MIVVTNVVVNVRSKSSHPIEFTRDITEYTGIRKELFYEPELI
ncbi:hypothetical protein [Parashewanella tropica]|nr:hypothetical protein [Parashewanella tropica]